jgi:hypothetical protein
MKWPVVLIGVVLIAAVLIFAISYGSPGSSGISTSTSTTSAEIIPNTPSIAYTNTDYEFSIMHPITASTSAEGFEGFLLPAMKPIVGIYLPESLFTATNLVEAGVFIGVSSDPEALNACLSSREGEEPQGTKLISNKVFQVFSSTDAAAGNIYEETSYRSVRNGDCFELLEMMHSGNIGNYPAGSVKQFDASMMRSILDTMVNTFSFSGQTGSGVEGKVKTSCLNSANCEEIRTIEAYQGVSAVALFKTSPDGTFSTELPAGQYELRVDTASSTHCASVGIVVTEGSFISTNISCEEGTVE